MENFQILTAAQVAALSPDESAKYAADLETFIAAFMAANPAGITTIECDIAGFGTIPNMVGGSPRVSVRVDEDDIPAEYSGLFVGQGSNTLLISPGRADVLGKNSGFMNFAHMGIALNSSIDKGNIVLDVALKVAGQVWKGKKNGRPTQGTYKHTHLAVTGFTYVPSSETSGRMGKIAEAAATQAFVDMMKMGATPATSKADNVEDEDKGAVEA